MRNSFPSNYNDLDGYSAWREEKLMSRPANVGALFVEIVDPFHLRDVEIERLLFNCDAHNMSFYRLIDPTLQDKNFIRVIGDKIGLHSLDGNLCADNDSITSLQTRDKGQEQGYIPYTPCRLNWHTDGYYNAPEQMVRGIIMHCVRPAHEGGENQFLDPDLLYIYLRDKNPAFITALMQPDTMTIPPNIENGKQIRGTRSGPVYSLDKTVNRLHMRYTARTKSIEWKNDSLITEALAAISEFLQSDSDWILRYRLQSGEGIICNNVLHNRSAYIDKDASEDTRLLYRARYYERVGANKNIDKRLQG